MASMFKKTTRKPIPDGAEIITRKGRKCARFVNKQGTKLTLPLTDDGQLMLVESRKWYINYKNADGLYRRKAGYVDRRQPSN